MDIYELSMAVEEANDAKNCVCLNEDLRDNIRILMEGSQAYIEIKEGNDNVSDLKLYLNDLREEMDSAQSSLSSLDDKFADIYCKLDDLEAAVDGMDD